MKHNINIKHIALIGLFAFSATSCNDWLTLYPQDRVVEENFWEDKNDLDGVRYAAYRQMSETIFNLIAWGDLRSDSYDIMPVDNGLDKRTEFIKVLNALPDSTMDFYDWGGVYTTINYCNKVLAHGEQVLERDAQFTTTEWHEIKAEMTALRALNYFYLIRAFKDIPYSTKVINSDEEVMSFSLTPGIEILDTLISDVRSVAGMARNRFTSTLDTKGMITNTAIYALLADMYLWRSSLRKGRDEATLDWKGDCDSVIYYGQLSLDALANQNELASAGATMSNESSVKNYFTDSKYTLANGTLISNETMTSSFNGYQNPDVASYSSIFESGNSRESIFELQYSLSDNRKNTTVNTYWGSDDKSYLVVNKSAIKKIYGDNETLFNEDSRNWYSCQGRLFGASTTGEGNPHMYKWRLCSFYNNTTKQIQTRASSYEYQNWIVYRQTEVMLMIAEALAVKANITGNVTNKNSMNENLKLALAIVNAIHMRASASQTAEAVMNSPYNTPNMLKVIYNERQIELLGEGKRWFDLVRYAERIGGGSQPDPREPQYMDGQDGMNEMVNTFFATKDELKDLYKQRFTNRYGLYCPIYYMERKANDYLIPQNPVWNREKEDVQASASTTTTE